MKMSIVALVVGYKEGAPILVETLHNHEEIEYLEAALKEGEIDPLRQIHQLREVQTKQDDEFADYVEDLLSKPFINPQIQKHGIQWLKSKIKIEQFQKTEKEAVEIISHYAYKVFEKDPSRHDFFLVSPTSQVRIRVFALSK